MAHDVRVEPGSAHVLGREEELSAIDEFLASPSPSGVLVIHGDAGIGKTTLWLHAVTLARKRSCRVLTCSPVEAEQQLSFVALADLLANVSDEVLADLPVPQAHALEVALRRVEPTGRPPDQFAIRAGFLGALRALATERPLVIAVDDGQYLDRPSELALAFAARRLRDEPVAFVVARRSGGEPTVPLGLDRHGTDREVSQLAIGALSLGAIHRLLLARLETSIRRPVLRRIYETSGGNPLFALELGRELLRRDDFGLAPDDLLQLPASLDALARDRLARLSPGTREVLLAAGSAARPTLELLEAIYGARRVGSALAEAVTTGVLEPERDRVQFSHPLLASACYVGASPIDRQRTHGRLARAVTDPEERARHLALSVSGPDEAVAGALDEGARHAALRGAPDAAAELAELAVARTPAGGRDVAARMLTAGTLCLRSGDARRAREHLRIALHAASRGEERAEILIPLAEAEEDAEVAIELCEQALAELQISPALRCRVQQRLARACLIGGLGAKALHHARAAVRIAEAVGDGELLVATLTESAENEFFYGRVDLARDLLDRALAAEGRVFVPLRESPRLSLARVLAFRDQRYDEALAIFAELLEEAERLGDEWARHRILWSLSALHNAAGDFREGHRQASEGLELAEIDGIDAPQFLTYLAASAAYLGEVDEARRAAARGLSLASASRPLALHLHHSLGLLELSLGNVEAADGHLRSAQSVWEASGSPADAGGIVMLANRIETLIALERLDEARALLARYRTLGGAHPFPGQRALACRCSGLLMAADGETRGALKAFEAALEDHARSRQPFERTRTLLWYGATLRRAKRRSDARKILQEALGEFERLSTPLWADKARAELRRIGGRTRSGELTETERRLVELVAEGRSNKEVAAALFLTPKTVSTQLSRIYAKLGIHSRSELVRRVLEESKV